MFPLNRKTRTRARKTPATEDSIARIAISEDGVIAYASSSFAALAGREPAELLNTDAADVLRLPEATQPFATIGPGAQKILFSGRRDSMTFHFDWLTTRDQKRYLVGSEITGARQDNTQNNTKEIFEAKILQARAKFAAAKPVASLEDLQRFAAMTGEIMLAAGELGEILRVNDALCTLLGYSREDLADKNFLDLFHEDDRPFVRTGMQDSTPAQDFTARILTKSGEERWMECRQREDQGTTYCLARDVTPIKRQERALSRREDQLREAESIARMGHWRWQIGEDAILWSDEIYRIFGVTRENFKPSLQTMNAMIHRRDISKVNQAFQRAIIEQNDYDMEFRVKRPDGAERFIRCEGRCAIDQKGEAVALYGVMQDMTAILLHERDLKEAKDAAERAYAAKSQFLANMSHELRTPLNAIIGFSEMMQKQLLGPVGNAKYLDYIGGIHESGEHLLDIISDILDMSKIEAGKYELSLEEVNVLKTLRLAIHMMESRAMDSDVRIGIEQPADETLTIVADRRAVLQIMLNLLSNAVKFSHKGGKVQIEYLLLSSPYRGEGYEGLAQPQAEPSRSWAGGKRSENFVTIRVTDHGIGIPANKLVSITNPFEQVSSHYTRSHEGTGLGLAITKDLTELHGGALQIESRAGEGTTVTVKLPLDAGKSQK